MLELRFPDGESREDIDPDFTHLLTRKDLIPAGKSYPPKARKLSKSTLTRVVERIKAVHGRALHRRRYELIDNFAAALSDAGKTAQVLPDGSFVVSPGNLGREAIVSLTARTPELGDYCSLHQRGGISASREGWLISPAPFFLAQRQAQILWLGGLSNIQHADEAQIIELAWTI